ncbi:hypothetical protein ACH95_22615 [Bacillus glycinifermentans]|uniref:DUF4062 domain-containing protein n=1 Tax=Bacillus glycinifermentans TaxID=1664069 RepID=A0AAJ3YXT1_9BACI|nr:DUF4062 domain-containing protein [Bacillus glycinifermentans]KMM52240.1 hypothetical protein ACH95_22615 [Bacillus glycinifermentans]MEC0497125.1 DUF4062 domain-containing protein [Bacillus glycinifermentans]MEC0542806.1 DUF4062 domain-containing protein [Bacillus glycinifermentans]QAT65254.1 DUF4062 domain-containing protein [Bacillus glycinifermentans]SCA85809.1 hypothetical protein BGLY_1986 [Bacillus glycinifermentans]
MKKRLQVFISSTYTDLIEERQAAVEAVLNAGHIPAGMELFKSGDQSQKETIKRWIDESDVYMLILGGRYGSIDQETGKSYTHWEYDYAGKAGKPRFAIVINEEALNEKVKEKGQDVIERANYQKYQEFKKEVLSKISRFFSDDKDIKIAILESLKEQENNKDLKGWVSGENSGNMEKILQENLSLVKENIKLKERINQMKKKIEVQHEFDGYSYEEILCYLKETKVQIPNDPEIFEESAGTEFSLLKIFTGLKDVFSIGLENSYKMEKFDNFLFYKVAPKLLNFNLLEKNKIAGRPYQRIQISKNGHKFVAMYEMKKLKKATED